MGINRATATGPSDKPWDLVVIGGGTAGIVASRTAVALGARVALVEGNRLGGDCLWTGCVPSKSLIAAASAAHISKESDHLGVSSAATRVDFSKVMAHVQSAIAAIAPVDSAEILAADGVHVLGGSARFAGPGRLDVNGSPLRFRQALIATGATPREPDVPGLHDALPLTSDTLWELRELPRQLLIVGGGAVGCEIGQAMARLGSRVTIVQRDARLLPREEPRASELVRVALASDGVDVILDHSIAHVHTSDGLSGIATLDDGREIAFDRVLAAVGRDANTRGLGLDAAGVALDDLENVIVDDRMRTSNPRIWAAGDVTALPRFTHTAGANASVATANALLGISRRIDQTGIPRVIFTDPEVAAVGESAAEATNRAGRRVVTWEHTHADRAVTLGATAGFTQLVVDGRGRIRGGTIVGPRAGESLGEVSLAVRKRLTVADLATTTHAYPTFNDAVWNAAIREYERSLRQGALGVVIGALRVVRGTLVRLRR